MIEGNIGVEDPPRFERGRLEDRAPLTRLGPGPIGGKAAGLARALAVLDAGYVATRHGGLRADVPRAVVLGAGVFEQFVERNRLRALLDDPDVSDRAVADAFQRADFPVEWIGDLTALAAATQTPLAIRSSGVLEDDAQRPFAGVYGTKMTPNHQPSPSDRFRRLAEGVKFVYASTWFRSARDYARAAGETRPESMAVLLQEVVGRRHGDLWYPDVAGVARSWNVLPPPGARREDGIVLLALGLGKTIVDGGACWSYSPARPGVPPPFESARDLLDHTQRRFWAIRMSPPARFDPTREEEWLADQDLARAESDGVLGLLASTHDGARERFVSGCGLPGPRALTFAPMLIHRRPPLADAVATLVRLAEESHGQEVEIEFAVTIDRDGQAGRLALLQVRPLRLAEGRVDVSAADLVAPDVVVASDRAIGNVARDDLTDVVWVDPATFDPAHSRAVAEDVRKINRRALDEGGRFVLIGFGRWGSADPWLGVPVEWSDISGAAVLVEVDREGRSIDPSQGSHFFHNLAAFEVSCLAVGAGGAGRVDWDALGAAPEIDRAGAVRRTRFSRPLAVRVDGRTGRAVIRTLAEGGAA
jgi:hypothetical protein